MAIETTVGPMDPDGLNFPTTRSAALTRWREFLPQAHRYAALRNRVMPGHPHVSQLSPALRSRLVTTGELVESVLAQHRFGAVEKFVQELVWRDYWKGWLEMRPWVWTAYREELRRVRHELPEAVRERAEAVMAGNGGIAVMDRFARELVNTGYLHNHARMWWAGYWCHVERLPWVIGADFFYRHLLDADPASNTLGWRWVAGLQTRGKAYLPRRSNLERYCAPEWLEDPTGLDRLADDRVTPCSLPADVPVTPEAWRSLSETPTESGGRWGLWVHGEDLTPERTALGAVQPAVVVTVLDEPILESFALSPGRIRAIEQGLADARSRAASHFQCPVEHRSGPGGFTVPLAQVARAHRLDGWIALRPAVGPLADAIPALETALAADGFRIQWCRRAWDERLWPLARSGYFPFWEKARRVLWRGNPSDLQLEIPWMNQAAG